MSRTAPSALMTCVPDARTANRATVVPTYSVSAVAARARTSPSNSPPVQATRDCLSASDTANTRDALFSQLVLPANTSVPFVATPNGGHAGSVVISIDGPPAIDDA